MAGRRSKRIALSLLLLLLLLAGIGGTAAWHWWLPGFLARRIVAVMQEKGLKSPAVEIRSLGLRTAEAANLHAAGPGWEVRLERLRTQHSPTELLTPRIAAIELDGLTTTLTPTDWPAHESTPPATTSAGPLLGALPAFWPVDRLLITNAVLRLRHDNRERDLPFWTRLAATPDRDGIRLLFASRSPSDLLRLDCALARDRDSKADLDFDLRRPAEWTEFLLGDETAALRLVQPGRLSGRIHFGIPAGGDTVSASLGLAPWTAAVPWGRLSLTNTRASLGAGRAGLGDLEVVTGLRFAATNGATVTVPSLRLDLAHAGRLALAAPEFAVSMPDGMAARAGLDLVIPDLRAGADASGRLTVALKELKVAGWRLDPREVHLRGNRAELAFDTDLLRASGPAAVLLSGVSGRLRGPLGPRQELEVSGRVSVEAPGQVAGLTSLPFHLRADRRPDQVNAAWSLEFTNLRPRLANGLELPELSGRITADVGHHTNRTEVHARIEAGSPRFETDLVQAENLTLTGVVQAAVAPGPRLVAPAVLSRLFALGGIPGDGPKWPAEADGWLSLRAEWLGLPGGGNFSEAELRLERGPVSARAPETWARLLGRAAAWEFGGLHLAAPRVEIALQDSAIKLKGALSLGDHPTTLQVTLQSTEAAPLATHPGEGTHNEVEATFHLGPLDLADFAPPTDLTGGQEVRLSGRLELAGHAGWQPGSTVHLTPTLSLELARVELPEQEIVIEHLAGHLDLASVNPPLSSTNATFTIGRIAWAGREATNLTLRVRALAGERWQVELARAHLFGGRVWTPPFILDPATGDLAVQLHLADLDLGRLSREIPNFAGRLEGRIGGVLSMRHTSGHWRPDRSRLELNSKVPASVAYPAEGLLTASLPPDSTRYEQLRLVEEGLKHLTLQSLRVDVVPPDRPETLARVRLAGASISPRAIVPIILNLNLNGDLEALLDVLGRGSFEFSF